MLCQNAIDLNNIRSFKKHGNYVYRIELDKVLDNIDSIRGKFGYFYEYDTDDINSITHIINTQISDIDLFRSR